jgi:putative AlgH/UPF0301 family transcriptional regulator
VSKNRRKIAQEKLEKERTECRENVLRQQKNLKIFLEYFDDCATKGKLHVLMNSNQWINLTPYKSFLFDNEEVQELEEQFEKLGIDVSSCDNGLAIRQSSKTYTFRWFVENKE